MVTTLARLDREQFAAQGYLVVEDVLTDADLQPLWSEYARVLDALVARLQAEGKLQSAHAELDFGERIARVLAESDVRYYQYFDISLRFGRVTRESPIHLGPAVFDLITHSRVLDVVQELIGPEIYSNPIQHVRIKIPERLVPAAHRNSLTAQAEWHQDQGAALPEADTSDVLTVWIAVTDATEENGCLCVIPRSHLGDLATHCAGPSGNGLRIPDDLRPAGAIPVPLRRGGVIVMHRRTMHSSLPNVSSAIRWSFDLRYQVLGQPTGRPQFPGFVARSARDPDSVLREWTVWRDLWLAAREGLAAAAPREFRRWAGDEPPCA